MPSPGSPEELHGHTHALDLAYRKYEKNGDVLKGAAAKLFEAERDYANLFETHTGFPPPATQEGMPMASASGGSSGNGGRYEEMQSIALEWQRFDISNSVNRNRVIADARARAYTERELQFLLTVPVRI